MSNHVFISYVREDSDQIERLVSNLEALGIEVWIDRKNLTPGERWRESIPKAIRAGDLFVACFSPAYTVRDRSHMNEELALAIEELRLRPTDRAWFIPVVIDEAEVPDRAIGPGETLRDLQWVNLSADWQSGVSAIAAVAQKARPTGSHGEISDRGSSRMIAKAGVPVPQNVSARRQAVLKLKNFVNASRSPQHSWKKMFGTIDPECQHLSRHQIIDRMFAGAGDDDLPLYLQTAKSMYQFGPHEDELRQEFNDVCTAFGVDPATLR